MESNVLNVTLQILQNNTSGSGSYRGMGLQRKMDVTGSVNRNPWLMAMNIAPFKSM